MKRLRPWPFRFCAPILSLPDRVASQLPRRLREIQRRRPARRNRINRRYATGTAERQTPLARVRAGAAISHAAFTPDDKWLMTIQAPAGPLLDIAVSGTRRPAGRPGTQSAARLWNTSAPMAAGPDFAGGRAGWDVSAGKPIGPPIPAGAADLLFLGGFSPDGKRLVLLHDNKASGRRIRARPSESRSN